MLHFRSTASLKWKLGLPGKKKISPSRNAWITFGKPNGIISQEYNELARRERKHFTVGDSPLPGKRKMGWRKSEKP